MTRIVFLLIENTYAYNNDGNRKKHVKPSVPCMYFCQCYYVYTVNIYRSTAKNSKRIDNNDNN